MVRPVKKKQIPNLQDAIKETAWKQLTEVGAPALSLRAIARALKITAPAIYNARDAVAVSNLSGRLKAIGIAYRAWAQAHPQRYQLIFGTPIPGYEAPLMEVLPSAARSLSALVSVVEQIRAAGKLNVRSFPQVKDEYRVSFETWKKYGGDADMLSMSVAMIIWARVHGIVSLEIANNLPPFGASGDGLYFFELDSITKQFIKI
jgi:hypothetical protein